MRRLVIKPDNILVDLLVIWYGAYQLLHLVVNFLSLVALTDGGAPFHALSPANGWSHQILHGFTSLAIVDLANGLIAILFILGYFRDTRWHQWLGLVTVSLAVFVMVIFDYVTIVNGAWQTNLFSYVYVNLTFVPVLVLFGLTCAWNIRGNFLGSRMEK